MQNPRQKGPEDKIPPNPTFIVGFSSRPVVKIICQPCPKNGTLHHNFTRIRNLAPTRLGVNTFFQRTCPHFSLTSGKSNRSNVLPGQSMNRPHGGLNTRQQRPSGLNVLQSRPCHDRRPSLAKTRRGHGFAPSFAPRQQQLPQINMPQDHLPCSSHKNRTNNGNLADATEPSGAPIAIPAFPPTR